MSASLAIVAQAPLVAKLSQPQNQGQISFLIIHQQQVDDVLQLDFRPSVALHLHKSQSRQHAQDLKFYQHFARGRPSHR